METKKCTKCGVVKYISSYNKQKKGKFGVKSVCVKCCVIVNKQLRNQNHEKYLQTQRIYREKNRERINDNKKIWIKINDPLQRKQTESKRKWAINNAEKVKLKNKNYQKNNKPKLANQRRIERMNLNQNYLKSKLIRQGLPITLETLELKKTQLLTHRLIIKSKNYERTN